MRRAIPPLPPYVFMALSLVKQRDNFTSTLLVPREVRKNTQVVAMY